MYKHIISLLPLFLGLFTTSVYSADGQQILDQAHKVFSEGDCSHASRLYRQAMREYKHDYRLFLNLAKCEQIFGRSRVALKYAKKANMINRQDIESHLLLGSLYSQQNKLVKARIAYQTALVIEPDNRRAQIGLAHIVQLLGDDAKVDNLLNQNGKITRPGK